MKNIFFLVPVFTGSPPSYWEKFGAPIPGMTQNNLVAHHPPSKISNVGAWPREWATPQWKM